MSIRLRALPAALCAVALVAPACSDGKASAPTIPPASTTVPPPTTAETSTPLTTLAPTDPPTTTAAPTTEAPPTTVDEITLLTDELRASRDAGEQAYRAAGGDPANEALRNEVGRYFGGGLLEQILQFYDELVADGHRLRLNDAMPTSVTLEGTIEFGSDSTVTMTECRVDSDVIYEPGAGPGGIDAIVNDDIRANRNRVTYERADGVWRAIAGETLGEWYGESTCPEQ